jgi:hypothetical protein
MEEAGEDLTKRFRCHAKLRLLAVDFKCFPREVFFAKTKLLVFNHRLRRWLQKWRQKACKQKYLPLSDCSKGTSVLQQSTLERQHNKLSFGNTPVPTTNISDPVKVQAATPKTQAATPKTQAATRKARTPKVPRPQSGLRLNMKTNTWYTPEGNTLDSFVKRQKHD